MTELSPQSFPAASAPASAISTARRHRHRPAAGAGNPHPSLSREPYRRVPTSPARQAYFYSNYVDLMRHDRRYSNAANGIGVSAARYLTTCPSSTNVAPSTTTRSTSLPSSSRCSTASPRSLPRRLASEGYGVRVYIPLRPRWYPYFMRRPRRTPRQRPSSLAKTSSKTKSGLETKTRFKTKNFIG